ncbi:DUF502 domain-containing protein [Chitinophaga jiangningensis]|nr:hypothetical protein [Chitinophaga jiangningensis]
MNTFWRNLRRTTAAGALLLLPVFAVIFLILKIAELVKKIVMPVAHHFPIEIPGIGKETVVTILLLLILCFLAGVFMKSKPAQQFKNWLETKILVHIPGYSYLRALSTDKLNSQDQSWRPASVLIDGNEVICFVVDETENYYSLFFPGAPTPTSGTVSARLKGDVRLLPISVSETFMIIRQLGVGAAAVLENLDRQQPLAK